MHDAGAAAAAAQVLAFFAEPVRYRMRLTHGQEPIQGGLHVYRFAQGRFPHGLVRDLSVPERERLREGSIFFIRQVCLWDGASHYQLLGVAPDARREVIKEHYHGLMGLLHPDRQEAASVSWPATAAQRVNRAYAVLSDEAARRAYDAGLSKSLAEVAATPATLPLAVGVHTPFSQRKVEAGARMRKPILAVAAASAALLFSGMWLIGDSTRDLAVLASATPIEVSARWMRENLAAKDPPRFLATSETRAAPSAPVRDGEVAPSSVPFLAPLWQALSTSGGSADGRAAPPHAGSEPAVRELEVRPASLRRAEAALVAQAALSEGAISVSREARADLGEAAAPLGVAEMEVLVARLVSCYEAGDVERLLALHDSAITASGSKVRGDFQEFFRATRTRRLRLERLAWEASGPGSVAKGEVTVSGELIDPPGRFERRVPIELLAAMREGQPRILRLSLFPHNG